MGAGVEIHKLFGKIVKQITVGKGGFAAVAFVVGSQINCKSPLFSGRVLQRRNYGSAYSLLSFVPTDGQGVEFDYVSVIIGGKYAAPAHHRIILQCCKEGVFRDKQIIDFIQSVFKGGVAFG